MTDLYRPRSAQAAFARSGGQETLWRVRSTSSRRAALLMDRSPSAPLVQSLLGDLDQEDQQSLPDVALALQALGHACRTHPMVLLARVGDQTVEEQAVLLTERTLSTLSSSPLGLHWHDGFASLDDQAVVHDGLLELARTLRQVEGVGPSWEGPTPSDLTSAAERVADSVATFFPVSSDGDVYLAPALAVGGRPVALRTSVPAHAVASRVLLGDTDLLSDVVRSLVSPDQLGFHGLRSLATSNSSFDPALAGRGAVDPLDTALLAWGLESMGFQTLAGQLWCRLTWADRANFPRLLPGTSDAGESDVVHTTSGVPVALESPITSGLTLLARYNLGREAQRRHRLVEDLPPGPLETELLEVISSSSPTSS